MAKPTSVATTFIVICGLVSTAFAGGFCGGFDLANKGQARQCLTDSGSRNGCYNRYGVRNSCWRQTSQSACCNHGRCAGVYDRYKSHCSCYSGWTGARCDKRKGGSSPSPPPSRSSCPSHAHVSSGHCVCDSGYKVNSQGNGCVKGSSCPSHAHESSDGKHCSCDSGYKVNSQRNGCVKASACKIIGNPSWNRYCQHGAARRYSRCSTGCGTSSSAPMHVCCASSCCSAHRRLAQELKDVKPDKNLLAIVDVSDEMRESDINP
jgi:hypothetical protein